MIGTGAGCFLGGSTTLFSTGGNNFGSGNIVDTSTLFFMTEDDSMINSIGSFFGFLSKT